MDVYNALGTLVKEVPDVRQPVGIKHHNLNLSDLAAGVYYIRIMVNNNKVVKKVVKL